MFSLESCIEFKGFLLNSLAAYEAVLIKDYKMENKIQQMTILSNSESISEDNLRKLDHLCEGICSISHYSQTFMFMFMLNFPGSLHVKSDLSPEAKLRVQSILNEVKKGQEKHSNIMQDIIGCYITFERPLLQNMLKKVFETDDKYILEDIKQKYDKEQIINRDLADEVFIVYQKCAIRAMYTLDMSTACAVVNIILSSLNDDIFKYLNSKISMFLTKSKKNTEMSAFFKLPFLNNDEKQRAGFSAKYTLYNACLIAYLNTFHQTCCYIDKLKNQLVSELDVLLEETEISFDEYKQNFHSSIEAEVFFQKTMFNSSLDFCSEIQKQ